jgi:hypothetical protein
VRRCGIVLAIGIVVLAGCGGGTKIVTVTESAGDSTASTTTSATGSTVTANQVRTCLQEQGLKIVPPPDSIAIDIGATPAYGATFSNGGDRVEVYVVDTADQAGVVAQKVVAFIGGAGYDNPESYVVQGGNALATFEDDPATDAQQETLESCFEP